MSCLRGNDDGLRKVLPPSSGLVTYLALTGSDGSFASESQGVEWMRRACYGDCGRIPESMSLFGGGAAPRRPRITLLIVHRLPT